jgi:putative ABC transport system ATP-binding protein
MTAGTPLVAARDLRREYHMGEELVRAVRGVTLDVDAGDYVAIVGPSGCGKSTLLNLIGGIDRPDAGSVTIDGARVDQMRDREATKFRLLHIGFVFQRFYLMPALTAMENVELPMAEARVPSVERERRARDLLAYVGLGGRRDHRPAQLSGGEKQRVAIARAFVAGPSLLFADEPTGNLDNKTGARILNLLFDMNSAKGTTLVLVTHDLDAARRCDRLIELEGGRLVAGNVAAR